MHSASGHGEGTPKENDAPGCEEAAPHTNLNNGGSNTSTVEGCRSSEHHSEPSCDTAPPPTCRRTWQQLRENGVWEVVVRPGPGTASTRIGDDTRGTNSSGVNVPLLASGPSDSGPASVPAERAVLRDMHTDFMAKDELRVVPPAAQNPVRPLAQVPCASDPSPVKTPNPACSSSPASRENGLLGVGPDIAINGSESSCPGPDSVCGWGTGEGERDHRVFRPSGPGRGRREPHPEMTDVLPPR